MTDIINNINEIVSVVNEIKKAEPYYDAWGFNLSIAILKTNVIVLSSKHWLKNCYIEVYTGKNKSDADTKSQFVFGLWDIITQMSTTIKRELERNDNITSYVYITELNRDQTLKVYEEIVNEIRSRNLEFDVVEKWNWLGWDVNEENTVKIPWVVLK